MPDDISRDEMIWAELLALRAVVAGLAKDGKTAQRRAQVDRVGGAASRVVRPPSDPFSHAVRAIKASDIPDIIPEDRHEAVLKLVEQNLARLQRISS